MKKQDFTNSHFVISRTDSLGDVILTLPMTYLLKSNFPGSTVSFLGRSYTRDIIECCEYVDCFLDWDEIKKKGVGDTLKTLNIDEKLIEQAITPKTKAIMPVHLLGNPCNIIKIKKIAKKYGLYLIEDAADSSGAEFHGKKVGSFGDFSTFSFFFTHII